MEVPDYILDIIKHNSKLSRKYIDGILKGKITHPIDVESYLEFALAYQKDNIKLVQELFYGREENTH